jgi:acid stress chaperone HdeA
MVEDTAAPIGALVAECQKTSKASFRTKVLQIYKSGQLALFERH